MKAIVQDRYGDASKLLMTDVEMPRISENDILIEVYAVNVSSGDMRINTLDVPLLLKPLLRLLFGWNGPKYKVRGISAAGKIAKLGANVTDYDVGDRVYFINSTKAGCLAEYVKLPKTAIMAKIPDSMTYVQAAPLTFGAMSAYHFMNEKTMLPGNDVLIYGASGAVGTYAIQLAKYYGCNITAVCSEKNHKIVRELGAMRVVDYHTTDYTKMGYHYHMVFDAVIKTSKLKARKVLTKCGTFVSMMRPTTERIEKLHAINKMVSEGKLLSVIDKVYAFEDYRAAHEHVYSKHKVGNVVITVKESD